MVSTIGQCDRRRLNRMALKERQECDTRLKSELKVAGPRKMEVERDHHDSVAGSLCHARNGLRPHGDILDLATQIGCNNKKTEKDLT